MGLPERLLCNPFFVWLLSVIIPYFCSFGKSEKPPCSSCRWLFHSVSHRSTDKAFDVLQRLVTKIGVVQFGVMAALGHQLVVRALFDDLAVIHDDDAVGVLDGGQAVGDDDDRAVTADA